MYVPHASKFLQYSASSSMAVESDGFSSTGEGKLASQIRQQIEMLNGKISETGVELDRCKQDQENFKLEYYKFRESNAKFETMMGQVSFCTWFLYKKIKYAQHAELSCKLKRVYHEKGHWNFFKQVLGGLLVPSVKSVAGAP